MPNIDTDTTPKKVSPEEIEAMIASEHYFTGAQGATGAAMPNMGRIERVWPAQLYLLTLCVLVLQNGFVIIGQSACVDPADFNAQIGRDLARRDAVNKLWAFAGFNRMEQAHQAALTRAGLEAIKRAGEEDRA